MKEGREGMGRRREEKTNDLCSYDLGSLHGRHVA
jgi:hypothetical protein